MDATFHPVIAAIKAGDAAQFITLVHEDPTLATARSFTSHPTLLQCLVLDGKSLPGKIEMLNALIDAGAPLDAPLVAAASCGNLEALSLLIDRGAAINGKGGWSPLEEALYWNQTGSIQTLLKRGATIHNLRVAAGLGHLDLVESFFNQDGTLKPEAGRIDWPFGTLEMIEQSNFDRSVKESLTGRVRSWSQDRQGIIDNAFLYACAQGHMGVADLLLKHGAQINAIPGGFDYAGSGLHYAALHGHLPMVQFLIERGADRELRDTKVSSTAAGWAEYGGHASIKAFLEERPSEATEYRGRITGTVSN